MTFLLAALAAVQAGTVDVDQFLKNHQAEIKAEIDRGNRLRSLTDEQALIVYDQCLSREAATLSRTEVRVEQVFALARQRCLAIKTDLLTGSSPARFARFKALDTAKEAAFPALTKQVRERRRAFEARNGK